MRKLSLKALVVLPLLFTLAGCGNSDQKYCAQSQYLNGADCQPVRWASVPIIMSIESLPAAYQDAFFDAVAIWEGALGRNLFGHSPSGTGNANTISIVPESSWGQTSVAQNAAAHTNFIASGSNIVRAQISFNGGIHFDTDGTDRFAMDLLSVMVHELGHVLGLNHTIGGVMSAELPNGIQRRNPAAFEVNLLNNLYGW